MGLLRVQLPRVMVRYCGVEPQSHLPGRWAARFSQVSHIEAAHETGKERESMKTRRVEPFRRPRGKRRAQSAESLVIILAYP